MIKISSFIVLFIVLVSCSNDSEIISTEVSQINLPISTPSGIRITRGDYSLRIQWDTIKSSDIKGYIIYRDTVSNPIKKYVELKNICSFNDKLLLLNKRYYYRISALDSKGKETEKSIEVNEIPQEPINKSTPINGEIGGLNYAFWDFPRTTFTKISHQFTIYNEPTNQDGSPNEDGLYYQFYQGVINDDIGFYYGIQTYVYNPNGNLPKRGIIFSRWGTRDVQNYKTAPGGFGQSAGYEGNFIGVRLNYEWGKGTYNIELKLESTDSIGDWYGLYITKISSQKTTYAGSIRFEKGVKSQGIKNGGITWTELYFKKNQLTPLPKWHVSIDKILADDTEPKSVYIDYNSDKFVSFTNIFTSNNKDVHFLMGPKVLKVNPKGKLWQ